MANYTQHYHLHQWEPEDSFLRTDFNGDFQRLDEALAGLDGRKPELRLGRYTGDGTQNRAVALGCAPRAVLLFCRDREALLAWPGAPYVYAYNNRPGNMLILTETGFQVHYDHYEVGLSDNDFLPVTNKAGESYRIWPWYSSEPPDPIGSGGLTCRKDVLTERTRRAKMRRVLRFRDRLDYQSRSRVTV
ncbi:MAG: hypothetical protein E7G43_09520 [Flavonifractor plautii]|nr:hypothetical protein [Flavonifractor plautii]